MFHWMLALAPRLANFRPVAMVITAHQNYWFTLSYAKLFGVEIIPSAHCVLWRPFAANPLHWRFLLWLDGLFFRFFVRRGMAISDTVASQMKALAKSDRFAVETLVPTYGSSHFEGISPPDPEARPFRVLFNGRAEANKGIFDLLHIAARLNRERPGQFHFDVCGEGSDLDSFRQRVNHAGLDEVISVHGFCDKDKLTRLLGHSHAVVVPTRSDFEEGLAKSCVEAVLAGRPFVSSAVCPAVKQLSAAAIEVAPDDARAYGDALLLLAEDMTLYQRKTEACLPLQSQFYDAQRSYKETLRRQLERTGVIDARLGSN
jgi:glycosyltransferase involved in cell wall biosynthesis